MAIFGLYPSAALLPAQRIDAATVLALDTPRDVAGVVSFGRSLWLPLPADLAQAQAVRLLAGSALSVRFEARRFSVGTEQRDWFPAVQRIDPDSVSITFTWPAEVLRVASPRSGRARQVGLFRADGKAVATEPAMQGTTGRDFAQAWVGSPLVIKLGLPDLSFDVERVFGVTDTLGVAIKVNAPQRKPATAARAVIQGGGAAAIGILNDNAIVAANAGLARISAQVPALTLSGRPTSPRLKLFAESAVGATLLWQSMLPGEQASATLPAKPVADEWAPALEQLRKRVTDAAGDLATAPLRLRLDIESDAPCTATLAPPTLTVETETELLDAPRRLAFSGNSAEDQPLPISVPALGSGSSLRLSGRVVADNDGAAGAGPGPADGRRGALLDDGIIALQALDWAVPLSLAGVALHWQPLSEQVSVRLRLLTDSSGVPGARVLAQAQASIDTATPGALALRWPALDLQAQRAWVEVAISAGAGVWLFAAAGGPGWIKTRNAAGARQPLPAPLTVVPITAGSESSLSRAISVRLDGAGPAQPLPQGPFEVTLAAASPAALAAGAIVFTGAVRGSASVESARWVSRDGG